jgi:hypothetical protein
MVAQGHWGLFSSTGQGGKSKGEHTEAGTGAFLRKPALGSSPPLPDYNRL